MEHYAGYKENLEKNSSHARGKTESGFLVLRSTWEKHTFEWRSFCMVANVI